MMSERHKHTEFLKHCLRYGEHSDRHDLHDKLSRIQHDMRIVKRAVVLLGVIFILSVAGVIASVFLGNGSPIGSQRFILNLLCALIAGSLISIAAFVGLWILFRRKLHRRREESRQFLTRLLATRLGDANQPPGPPGHPQPPPSK